MQQLQEPILNQLQPGINPIFIVSPNRNDGDTLALLLSKRLAIKSKYSIVTNNKQWNNNNYFFTDDVRKLIPPYLDFKKETFLEEKKDRADLLKKKEDKKADKTAIEKAEDIKVVLTEEEKKAKEAANLLKKLEETKSSTKFIIEKGFDSSNLWGLQVDYRQFFELNINELFPNAFFIFLYGTSIKKYNAEVLNGRYPERIYDFYLAHKTSSILLHVNAAAYIPELILSELPLSQGLEIRKNKESSQHELHSKDVVRFPDIEADTELKKKFDEVNLINQKDAWFKGNDLLHIMIVSDYTNHENILKKIYQYNNSFLESPQFVVICKNETENKFIQQILEEVRKSIDTIRIETCHSNIATTINEIIAGSGSAYVTVDNINQLYSVVKVLSPFRKGQPPVITFSNISTNRLTADEKTLVGLTDILSIRSIPDNITFLKSSWTDLDGFDTSLDQKATLWDFCIRGLKTQGAYALESESIIINPDLKGDTLQGKYESMEHIMIPYEKYKDIIDKHRGLFEQNINKLVKIFSENQHLPQYEIIKLNHNVATLNSYLSHSKHELHTLTNQKTQLQAQVNLLESRWHFKLVHKLVHLKNIFFKEGGGSGSGIFKVLKFFIFAFTRPGIRIIRKLFKGVFRRIYLIIEDRPVKIVYLDQGKGNGAIADNYNEWVRNKLDIKALKSDYNKVKETFTIKPKFSVIVPVYNPNVNYLDAAIKSVIDQFYDNWELCIADDCSPNPQIKRLLNSYALKDSRIKVIFREENGHISACSNSALSLATGDYIMLLDHDDMLTPNCMYEVVKHINEHPEDDFIYSDEDKVDDSGAYTNPFFKPNWSPDRFLALNYVAHVVVIRKSLMDKVNGFRLGFEGSQDYDLILRITEHTKNIGHIPEILYHWRIHSLSVASAEGDAKPYAYIAAKKALEEALTRRGISGEVHYSVNRGSYRIKYNVSSYDKVSIIIPTKDQALMMKNTIDSIFALTSYPNFEVVVLNNNSTTKEFFELMSEYADQFGDRFKCIEASFPFNFSKLMNVGVAASTGKYILMLNNDVEITHDDWITRMVSFAQQERIGAVGVKLLYPNDNIQHAGTIIGLGAAAGHIYVGVYKDTLGYFNCLQLTTNYSAVTAACLMLRRSVYDEINGMEEKLEVEYNDVDFCLRIMEKGYFNVYVPDVVLYHYESATRGHPHQNKVSYQRHLREVKYFQDTWGKYIKHDPFYNHHLSYIYADSRIEYNS